MSPAKITLSPAERQLVADAGFILTKNAVIDKVRALLGGVSASYQPLLDSSDALAATGIDLHSAKISKGERYETLPWVMLDHPRYFKQEDVLAVRSFFWWGNFCSVTLQLSGTFAQRFATSIEHYFETQAAGDWHYCVSRDQWQHHFRADNYVPIAEQRPGFGALPFIKIAKKIGLEEWDRLDAFFEESLHEIVAMLGS